MNKYQMERDEEITEAITRMLEEQTGQKIFTMRVEQEEEDNLQTIVVMEDKSVLKGLISVQTIDGKLACRMQLNYI